ncbi:MAG: hypothetical protein OCD01_03305 [Fibrobacterales bacterium]
MTKFTLITTALMILFALITGCVVDEETTTDEAEKQNKQKQSSDDLETDRISSGDLLSSDDNKLSSDEDFERYSFDESSSDERFEKYSMDREDSSDEATDSSGDNYEDDEDEDSSDEYSHESDESTDDKDESDREREYPKDHDSIESWKEELNDYLEKTTLTIDTDSLALLIEDFNPTNEECLSIIEASNTPTESFSATDLCEIAIDSFNDSDMEWESMKEELLQILPLLVEK